MIMEKLGRPSCKVNTFFRQPFLKLPFTSLQEEETKNSLFQIADEPPSPLKTRHLNLDAWSSTNPVPGQNEQQAKTQSFMRKTVHLRTQYMSRKRYDIERGEQKSSHSIIPKLKSLLMRLESPEKQNYKQTESFIKVQTAKQDQLNPPKRHNNSIRITNYTSQKKSRKGLSVKERTFKTTGERKGVEEHLILVRQARRKRTLKNLIF